MRTFLLFLWASCASLSAMSIKPSHPEVFSSPAGRHVIRMEAAESVKDRTTFWHRTKLMIFAYDAESESFAIAHKFEIEGHPAEILINDAGTHVITVGNKGREGSGQIAALYDSSGKRLSGWTLEDLYPDMATDPASYQGRFGGFPFTTAWRGTIHWNHDQSVLHIAAPAKREQRPDGSVAHIYPGQDDGYEINLEAKTMTRISIRKPVK